ncbi:hypothetical protein CVT26_002721 [Gymnopilus dilepis]|uniref:Uncharacterized protein n=1 Tax=Gymnopilus dilepis TaxID=231916 RepID=A0A409Y3D1_9AGAR|nr:hypothetical protein CVT26_002721 [Gymnopilus dilepis]
MVDGGIGVSAAVAIGAKFIERSKFTARHDGIYDKEDEKRVRLAERFEKIPKEDVDHFEWEEYNSLHARSLQDLRSYRDTQDEYKSKEWYKQPVKKYRTRGRVRQAKRQLQSSIAAEGLHIEELEAHSRSNSSRCSSVGSVRGGSESGLDLERSRPYRTDSCSLRATGGSPPSASLDDINSDEHRQEIAAQVTDWLSSVEPVNSTSPYGLHTGPATTDIHPDPNAFRLGEYYSDRRWQDDSKWPQEASRTIDVGPKYKT